ncbi:alpha-2-macroglobulin [Bizionia sediminis]|uniref:Alpha-2-macroglobulin n=1 Tax=Bizionia sediminis TaxID=1737064 RepID=A0ABW5KUK2_9FLAO
MSCQKLISLLLALVVLSACNTRETQTDNLYKFREYISFTSSGLQSVADPIYINLAKPIKNWEVDTEITENILTISPHVSGKLFLSSAQTLLFKPDEWLEPDTEYTVSVNLKDIYKTIPNNFNSYTFQFKTISPNFNINTTNLQSYSKEWQYLEGVLHASDVITLKQAKQLVAASQNKKTLQVVFNEYHTEGKIFDFKIDSIHRTTKDSEIVINWDGKAINAKYAGTSSFKIPGIENFSIVSVQVMQQPEQHVSINFSDPLKKQQNFDGLVTIASSNNPKFSVDGHVLNVYPESKLVGNLALNVFEGITSTDGFKLKQEFSETLAFENLKPQVRLIRNGNILPNSQQLKFNFEAVNLSAVDVRIIKIFQNNVLQFLQDADLNSTNNYAIRQVGRRIATETIALQSAEQNTGKWRAYSIDLSHYFKADPGAIYRVELSFNKNYALYDCTASHTSSNTTDDFEDSYYENHYYGNNNDDLYSANETIREEAYWDNLIYSYKDDIYNWSERDNPCHKAYYNDSRVVSQNLIASNLGVIAKRGDNNSYYFAVTNILTTNPEPNAVVTLYNYQQQELTTLKTDSEGLLTIDADKHAAFALVKKDNSTTYLKLDDGNALSLSKFDVSGNKMQRGLKGYLYGERGVWRPGDTLNLTFILNDKANKLPKNHPVTLEITDPNGKLIYNHTTSLHNHNFYRFTVPTNPEDKTGNYNAKVVVGGAVFYKTLKIETVKPNRLKINVAFENDILTNNKPLAGTLDVKWLHGAVGKNLKAEIKAKISSSYSGFQNYKNYIFSDPTRTFETEELTVFEGSVNAEGIAKINNQLEVGKNAPGMLNVQFLVRAFENGGDFSMDAFTMPFAPYESFVGLQSPEPKAYGSFFTDENQTFDVVVVDKNGKPIQRNNLEVKIYKIEWRWWWNAAEDNLSSYVSSNYHKPYLDTTVNTNAQGKGSFNINIPDEEGGRYLIRVMDPESGHATGRTAYFYKNWWQKAPTNDKEAAKMLVFSADKETYTIGETAIITFNSGSEGRALVSVENGTEVIDTKWVTTQQGETEVRIPITPEMAPNVFINISLLQPHAITANDLPIRLFGVIPLMVEDPNTKLEPQLKMPDELQPEQEFTVKVSEKNNKAMTYTIAVVEEGLLDLTRFKTPNAWNAFYAREALGVKTWDVFDAVIGAYTGSIDQVFAIGGDANALAGKNKKANRFKPVVRYLGPFHLEAGNSKSHNIKLPNYIGAVRTMVVAGNATTEAYGSTDKTVQVKKPLMVLASLPRKLSPGELVTLPVTVFAMDKKVKNASISLKLSNGISVIGEKTQHITFNQPDEQMRYFQLDVSQAKGFNTIEVIATGNGEKSTYKVEIDVVNPNPITSKSLDITVQANTQETLNFSTFGEVGTNKAAVEFSTLPPMDFTKRLQFLIQYPHGCLEQTTSGVFPQLFLNDIFDLTVDKKQDIQKNIEIGIKRLAQFQLPNGGMSYWLGENTPNDWSTSYAGHFMLEAEKKGFVLPLTFKSNWLAYQKQAARNWLPSFQTASSDLAQAYRLYTLALAGQPDLAAMNRLREFSNISNESKWRLAAAYALAGQLEASQAISQTATTNFQNTKQMAYTFGSVTRNRAMALETMVLTKNPQQRELAEYLAKSLSSNAWMSTQTTAYSLLAMAKMVEANGGKDLNLEVSFNGKSEQIKTNLAIAQRDLNIKNGTNQLTVTNKNANTVYLRLLNAGKLPLGEELEEQRGLDVLVNYKDLAGNKLDIATLQQGQDFVASVTITNLKNDSVTHVALTQLFPSGWEIINTRFTDFGTATTSQARYTDIRDNEVNYYFDLGPNGNQGQKTFHIMLNASYLGTYYLPGIQAEAMYDSSYFVRNKGQWITVGK